MIANRRDIGVAVIGNVLTVVRRTTRAGRSRDVKSRRGVWGQSVRLSQDEVNREVVVRGMGLELLMGLPLNRASCSTVVRPERAASACCG
jgi:hypothetical protein